jgi:hypothetical protein
MNFGTVAVLLASPALVACQYGGTTSTVKPPVNLFRLQEPPRPIPTTSTFERREIQQLMAKRLEEKRKQELQEELLLVELAAKEKALQLELQAQQARVIADKISAEVQKELASQNQICTISQQKSSPLLVHHNLAATGKTRRQAGIAKVAAPRQSPSF